ncbi:MAG: XRE family transcriptional regulator [Desulfomonilaceae bacterium]
MARKFAELREKMSDESRARAHALYQKMAGEMALHELRRARGISQEELAKILRIKQPNVAKMEKRADIYISTLRAAIEAMGGTLDIVASFPEGKVKIKNFSSLGEGEAKEAKDKRRKRRSSAGICAAMALTTNSTLPDK